MWEMSQWLNGWLSEGISCPYNIGFRLNQCVTTMGQTGSAFGSGPVSAWPQLYDICTPHDAEIQNITLISPWNDSLASSYLAFGYSPLTIVGQWKIFPYYLGHHALGYIFKKSAQTKRNLAVFLWKVRWKHIIAFLVTKAAHIRRSKPHYWVDLNK